MAKKGESNYGGKQKRITPAEKQRGANKPRPLPKNNHQRGRHPGSPGKT